MADKDGVHTSGGLVVGCGDHESDGDDNDHAFDDDDDLSSYGEGDGQFGFPSDDVIELLAQGVKPWEEDAHAVLGALRVGARC